MLQVGPGPGGREEAAARGDILRQGGILCWKMGNKMDVLSKIAKQLAKFIPHTNSHYLMVNILYFMFLFSKRLFPIQKIS